MKLKTFEWLFLQTPKKSINCHVLRVRLPCQIPWRYCWTTYWEMAIFCSLAMSVSINVVFSSSTEFNIAPGDSMLAATLLKGENKVTILRSEWKLARLLRNYQIFKHLQKTHKITSFLASNSGGHFLKSFLFNLQN